MEIQHFSHVHPLILTDKKKKHGAKCAACELPVRGPAYECASCVFCVHKSCSEVSQEIRHPLHWQHSLNLLSKAPYRSGNFTCFVCHQSCSGFIFHCQECKFDMDIECALETHDVDSEICDDLIQHPSHNHPLKQIDSWAIYGTSCTGCESLFDASSSVYACTKCNFFLHKTCSELPKVIQHHFDTASSFVLIGFAGTLFICHACKNNSSGFKYIRYSGGMDIDLGCVSLKAVLKVDGHKHRLTFFDKKVQGMKCNACGIRCSSDIFRCVKCNYNLHFHCAPVSLTIKHECHIHPLTLTKFDDEDDAKEYYCHACESRRNPKLLVYHCEQCSFTAHINCVISEVIPSSPLEHDEADPPEPKGSMHLTRDPFLIRFDDAIDEVNEDLEKLTARLKSLQTKQVENVKADDHLKANLDEEIAELELERDQLTANIEELKKDRSIYEFQHPLSDMP
ncbi:hypothetical protein K2173_005660 [Erythroxylum novogranatense]|uniref:Phorbol-ester/DAG-type domain-containing protein n=1 Tax=Erythroxylum novogranatense TaxID=1862640 RepID=A0AAV8SRG9_9ROSI|nr:hypothetical protein K2173_005660 [Erythroxylum novogranatense]